MTRVAPRCVETVTTAMWCVPLMCALFAAGLDSNAALIVMECMGALAAQQRIVVASIHQPRAAIWELFDKAQVLSEGHMLYFGPTDKVRARGSLPRPRLQVALHSCQAHAIPCMTGACSICPELRLHARLPARASATLTIAQTSMFATCKFPWGHKGLIRRQMMSRQCCLKILVWRSCLGCLGSA